MIFLLDASMRHCFEMDEKDFNSDTDLNNFGYLRSRIGFRFLPVKNVSGYIQFQDSRVMGTETSTMDGSANMLDLHQGYINVDSISGLPVGLKIGRFEANYGNQRLIGVVGWHNVGRSFDGVTFRYTSDYIDLDLFNFKVNEFQNQGNDDDVNLSGAWANLNLVKNIKSDFYVIWQRIMGRDSLNIVNLGTNIGSTFGDLKGLLELNYQTGALNPDIDIEAMMLAFNATYQLADIKFSPALSAGFEYLSGDDNPMDNKYKVFNTLYATNHKFYGISDFFLNIPLHTYDAGLTDIHLKLKLKPCEKSLFNIAFHNFSSSEEVNGETEFGNELDFIYNFKYNESLNIQSGYGLF